MDTRQLFSYLFNFPLMMAIPITAFSFRCRKDGTGTPSCPFPRS